MLLLWKVDKNVAILFSYWNDFIIWNFRSLFLFANACVNLLEVGLHFLISCLFVPLHDRSVGARWLVVRWAANGFQVVGRAWVFKNVCLEILLLCTLVLILFTLNSLILRFSTIIQNWYWCIVPLGLMKSVIAAKSGVQNRNGLLVSRTKDHRLFSFVTLLFADVVTDLWLKCAQN